MAPGSVHGAFRRSRDRGRFAGHRFRPFVARRARSRGFPGRRSLANAATNMAALEDDSPEYRMRRFRVRRLGRTAGENRLTDTQTAPPASLAATIHNESLGGCRRDEPSCLALPLPWRAPRPHPS
eukprot:ctg_126.g73